MIKRRRRPSQGWRTFLRNHAEGIAAMHMFVVSIISRRVVDGQKELLAIKRMGGNSAERAVAA